jgi:hypothetical protein
VLRMALRLFILIRKKLLVAVTFASKEELRNRIEQLIADLNKTNLLFNALPVVIDSGFPRCARGPEGRENKALESADQDPVYARVP